MSFACRVSFYLLLLSLNLVNPPFSPSQSLVSTPSPLRSSDEETLRRMTEQYGRAMEEGDLEAMSRLGSPQSSALPARLKHYRGVFSNIRVEFLRMNVSLMEVTGERAVNKQLARATESDERDSTSVSEIEPLLEKARLNYEAFQNSLYAAHPELKVQRGEAPIINAEELASLLAGPRAPSSNMS